jgi:Cu+-exporting ATPase
MNQTATAVKNAIDPVCGMSVDPAKTNITYTFNEQTFHFCAEGCRQTFEICPRKYLEPKPVKKGLWGRYMDRLQKATGGKPMKCH